MPESTQCRNTYNTPGATDIDWAQEISVDTEISCIHAPTLPAPTEGLVIALTGATGFLGLELVKQLLESPKVKLIHALCVRNEEKLAQVLDSKLVIYTGDLSRPGLGMTEEAIKQVFGTSNVVIHSGADVSFLKSYAKIRPTNFEATKVVLRLALQHGHVRHLHYVSTAGFSVMLDHDLYEESLQTLPPAESSREHPTGYFLSKWASELYLEQASAVTGMRVTIHRPSVIVGEDAPNLDLMANVLQYSAQMAAVPSFSGIEGAIQLVRVEDVAGAMISAVAAGDGDEGRAADHNSDESDDAGVDVDVDADDDTRMRGQGACLVRWYNHSGRDEDCVDVHKLGGYLSRRLKKHISVMSDTEWVAMAAKLGLPSELAGYMNGLVIWHRYTGGKWVFRRAVRGTQTP